MKRPEQQLHQAVARYLDLALPADAWWTTIPLGGGGRIRGALLKSMGAKKGTPDILIVHEGVAHFVELKAGKGKPSPAQVETADAIREAGGFHSVAWSLKEVDFALYVWGIPLRARVAA